ncbi:hypothetical protein PAXINDRAFT_16320 [Paxillus involutus ATCC 200175]|uniref:Unplaced genomic scaffold PAXINscaffold_76, whole genome shotgun sequence n=1 Tax=Paxillus involutus ATCC 200175 TaxID=664439 RepID=A0A0C9TSD8_PAXIN|nr:hypothetical protein PAXINDRAFT_16320 [Paxillus involutus ATCC 200175]
MSTSDPPISRLPDELLIIIFGYLTTSSSPPDQFPFALSVPMLLSHVSRRWRTIISTTPSMWIKVPISPFQPGHTLRSFLRHSLPLPISVTVYPWPQGHPYIRFRTLAHQFELLLREEEDRERIHDLRIEDSANNVIGKLVDRHPRPRFHFPALRHVSLCGARDWRASCFFDDGNAPVLKSLVLENATMNYVTNLLLHPPQRLTTLVWKCSSSSTIDGLWLSVPIELFSHFVASFPSLTALELHGPVVVTEDNQADPTLLHYLRAISHRTVTLLTEIKSLRIAHPFTLPTSPLELFRRLPSLTHIIVGKRAEGRPGLASSTLCVLRGLAGSPEILPVLDQVLLEFTDAELNSSLGEVIRDKVKTWLEGRDSMRAMVSVPIVMVNGTRVSW